jgi:hypothetical protein
VVRLEAKMVTEPRFSQNWKAQLPILVTLAGITMLDKSLHSLKAASPILVTLEGMVMLVTP